MAENVLSRYGYGYIPPQLGDSEDYSTRNVLAAYGRPRQGPIARALGVDPSIERDAILPFRSGSWRPALPQFVVDIVNAADKVGSAPIAGGYNPAQRGEMIDAAGAVVGPQMAYGFMRNALAPRGGGSELGIFGGRLAQNAPLSKLEMAKWMTEAGAPREQVWNETGWFKGVDGKWRFEIDDSAARFAADKVRGSFRASPAGTVIDHPALFEAYPDTRTIGIGSMSGDGASYRQRGGLLDRMLGGREGITIGDEAPPATYLHELQHAVQRREGTATGANADRAPAYPRIAGEVEARAVERRMNLTPDQRRERPPWLDYDVPEGEQIVARARFSSNSEGNPAIMARDNEAGFLPPTKPQRPFEDDYRTAPEGDRGSPLSVDIDGRPLDARFVAGRRTVGGDDVPLTSAEVAKIADYAASMVEFQPRHQLPRRAVGAFDPVNQSIRVADDLAPDQKAIALAHETGHAIDSWPHKADISKHTKAAREIYSDLATGQPQIIPSKRTGPEHFGYPRAQIMPELMAEAIRAYLTDPNYVKSVSPALAKEIRKLNDVRGLNKLVQFNAESIGPQPLSSFDDDLAEILRKYGLQ